VTTLLVENDKFIGTWIVEKYAKRMQLLNFDDILYHDVYALEAIRLSFLTQLSFLRFGIESSSF
jgi:hypothetical protein